MAGALYVWLIGGCFLGTILVIATLILIFRIGHWLERRQTGATHNFLELPTELRTPPKDPNGQAPS